MSYIQRLFMAVAAKRNSNSTEADSKDAITLLSADHEKFRGIFKQFELVNPNLSRKAKAALVQQACIDLKIHFQIETEIFYPAVREASLDDDVVDEADVEHAQAKGLIEQLEAMQPGKECYDARVVILGKQIECHIQKDERDMFPRARKAKVDTAALGEQMYERKLVLMGQIALPDERKKGARTSISAHRKASSIHCLGVTPISGTNS